MNPMIRKELHQRMRERRGWLLLTLYLMALGAVVVLGYYFQVKSFFGIGPLKEPQGAEIGVTIFHYVIFTQMALLLLLAPVFTAGAITIEKEQRTLAGLLTSLLTAAQIWWGKFAAAMLFLMLLLVSALPVLSLAFALGGIGPLEVLRAAGVTAIVIGSLSAVGLYCSSFFKRSVHATAVTYAIVIALTLLTFVAFTIRMAQINEAGGSAAAEANPYGVVAPLFLNPFYPLLAIFGERESKTLYPTWALSLQLFVALGCLATALALRNIQRSGEHV